VGGGPESSRRGQATAEEKAPHAKERRHGRDWEIDAGDRTPVAEVPVPEICLGEPRGIDRVEGLNGGRVKDRFVPRLDAPEEYRSLRRRFVQPRRASDDR